MASEPVPPSRFALRDQPLILRLVLGAFLLSVGAGYLAALVQMHYKAAGPGQLFPSLDRVVEIYHGSPGSGKSGMEQILEASETLPFASGGSMRAAFTERSAGWNLKSAQEKEKLRPEREIELQVILAWVRDGARQETFDKFPLTEDRLAALNVDKLAPQLFQISQGHGPAVSEMERILEASESLPFASGGSMRAAFTDKSAGWETAIDRRAVNKHIKPAEAEEKLRQEREAERLALLAWVRNGARQETYEKFPLPEDRLASLKMDKLPAEFFRGGPSVSEMERIVEASESLPFASGGSMRAAFTDKSAGWESAIDRLAEDKNLKPAEAEKELRQEREIERLAMIDWVRDGAKQETYEKFPLSPTRLASLKTAKLSARFFGQTDDGKKYAKVKAIMVARCARCHDKERGAEDIPLKEWKDVQKYCTVKGDNSPRLFEQTPDGKKYARIKAIMVARCARCHESERGVGDIPLSDWNDVQKYCTVKGSNSPRFFEQTADGKKYAKVKAIMAARCARCHESERGVEDIPLKEWEDVHKYCQPELGGGMSFPKLAQTTHIHLLAFSMLYGLTGILFALTSYSSLIRLLIAPLPLVAQLAELSCWWLAKLPDNYLGVQFAQAIVLLGGLVGLGLSLQILLGLWSMFRPEAKP